MSFLTASISTEFTSKIVQKWDGNFYKENSDPQWVINQMLLKILRDNEYSNQVCKEDLVIDIGCGNGRVTQELKKMFNGKVLGIDSSESMIKVAKQDYPDLDFKVDDGEKLATVEDKTISLLTSFCALHWFDYEKATISFDRVLKEGGELALLFGGHTTSDKLVASIEETVKQYAAYLPKELLAAKKTWYMKNQEEIKKIFGTKFQNVKVYEVAADYYFENIEKFKTWLLGSLPQVRSMQEDKQPEVMQKIAEAYLDKTKELQPKDERFYVMLDSLFLVTASKA